MKYLKQWMLILIFTLLGELLKAILPFQIPAGIYGLILMFLSLVRDSAKRSDSGNRRVPASYYAGHVYTSGSRNPAGGRRIKKNLGAGAFCSCDRYGGGYGRVSGGSSENIRKRRMRWVRFFEIPYLQARL